jgi:transcriptional regulator with XRE-family HTH domain
MARQTLSLPIDASAVRTARERAGLNMQGFADRCRVVGGYSVSPSYLGKVERGLYRPSAPLLKAISLALGVEIDDLITSDGAA